MTAGGDELQVAIVRTGTANLASVVRCFRRAGTAPRVVDAPDAVTRAARLVLPGVGAFAAAMASLRSAGLVDPLRRRLAAGRPTLAICLGMQILAAGSDENPGVEGLGLLPAQIRRLHGPVRIPQIGWNVITPEPAARLVRPGHAYFANSYCLEAVPENWSGATTSHGQRLVASIERGAILGCQFHPELSGAWGLELICRWLSVEEDQC